MSDFSQDIQNFERYGTYDYNFDDVGNLTFNSSSSDFNQNFLALPLSNIFYNNSKIQTFYDVDFVEFIPTPTSSSVSSSNINVDILQQQLGMVQQENTSLKSQLDDLTVQNQISSSVSDTLATQQVILELRIALGQGRVTSDFSDTFPYTPVNK